MPWFKYSTRLAAVLTVIGLTGCVTTAGYRYVNADGNYYYDDRPAVTTTYIAPYGALGYGSPGGWHGALGFGFGTYYGLGGYYGSSWGAFGPRGYGGPRYGYTGYWRPPYYYQPRYPRPQHYYRHYPAHPLRSHDSANIWQGDGPRRSYARNRWNTPPPAPVRRSENRPWHRTNNTLAGHPRPKSLMRLSRPNRPSASTSMPPFALSPSERSSVSGRSPVIRRARAVPRDMTVQVQPSSPPQPARHVISTPSHRGTARVFNRSDSRMTSISPRPVDTAAPAQNRRHSVPMTRPSPVTLPKPAATPPRVAQPTPAAVPSRSTPQSRSSVPATRPASPAPRTHSRGSRRLPQPKD